MFFYPPFFSDLLGPSRTFSDLLGPSRTFSALRKCQETVARPRLAPALSLRAPGSQGPEECVRIAREDALEMLERLRILKMWNIRTPASQGPEEFVDRSNANGITLIDPPPISKNCLKNLPLVYPHFSELRIVNIWPLYNYYFYMHYTITGTRFFFCARARARKKMCRV